MNFERKKIIAISILFFGVVVSIAIFARADTKKSAETGVKVEIAENARNPQLQPRGNSLAKSSDNFLTRADDSATGANLTDTLVGAYAQEIAKQNPNGFETVDGKKQIAVPPNDIAEKLFDKQLEQKIQFPTFTLNDIAISQDNSKDAQIQYAADLITITRKNFSGITLPLMDMIETVTADQNTKPLAQYVSAIPNEISDLLALRVPSDLKQFHLQNLNLWQRKYAVYSAFLDYANDPMKTIIAMGEISELIMETENLKQVLVTHIEHIEALPS